MYLLDFQMLMSNLGLVLQSDMSEASVQLQSLRTNLTSLQNKMSSYMDNTANSMEELYQGVSRIMYAIKPWSYIYPTCRHMKMLISFI